MGNYSPVTRPNEFSATDTGVDVNAASTTTTFVMVSSQKLFVVTKLASGTYSAAVVTVQCSDDGITWNNSSNTITGPGMKDNISTITPFVRVKVTSLEGSTGTADITLVAK